MVALLKNEYDIIIIGSGPAGASAAYFSKFFDNNSKKVLTIESLDERHYTRYHHMCGEVVSRYIKDDFPDIQIEDFVVNKIDKVIESWANEVKIYSTLKGYVLNRPKFFLNILRRYQKQGGNFFQDRFIDFQEKKGKINIQLKNKGVLKTKYLIFATGPKKLKNSFFNFDGDTFSTLLYQILVRNYPLEKNCVEFYYDERYKDNYKWIFPYGNHVKIGVPYENKDELKDYEKYKIIRKDVKQVYCGILNTYAINNILFIGDAAFQNNPLTKGGIRAAINAGKIAAESLVKYDDPQRYDKMWKKSGFFAEPYLLASKKLSVMKNEEIIYHSKPLKYFPISIPWIFLKYKKYLSLYKIYYLSEKFGW